MKRPLFLMPAFAAVFAVSGALWAQVVHSNAGLADPTNNLLPSARAAGLGSAFVGVADDSSALFWNSAGLSDLSKTTLDLHHNSYLAGTFQETLEVGLPVVPGDGLGFSVSYIEWGSVDLRDANGLPQGSYNDNDVGLSAGWGHEWTKGFSTGLAFRIEQDKIVDNLYTSLAGDAGLLWSPQPGLRLGLVYSNLGAQLGGNGLAGNLNGGASYRFGLDAEDGLLAALAGGWQPGGVGRVQSGLETDFGRKWFLRAGWQIPLSDNQVEGFTNFSAGAGARFGDFRLDYAYAPFGDLGVSHRISIGYDFEASKEVVQVPVTIFQPAPPPPETPSLEVHFKFPKDPYVEGQKLEQEGKAIDAIQAYSNALRQDSHNVEAWKALGRLYFKLGEKKYAIQSFESALQLQPDDVSLRKWLEKYKGGPP